MGIQLTAAQVTSMAPDASSTAAGKKLANTKHWQQIGQNSDALWGECQGSALYRATASKKVDSMNGKEEKFESAFSRKEIRN